MLMSSHPTVLSQNHPFRPLGVLTLTRAFSHENLPSSIGLTPSGKTQQQQQQDGGTSKSDGGPSSLLQDASPSRLLYSLMIVEHLLDRDVSSDAAAAVGAEGDVTSAAARLAAMAGNGNDGGHVALCGGVSEDKSRSTQQQQQQSIHRRSDESGGGGSGGGAWKVYQPAAYGAAVDDFITGCGGIGVSVGVVRRSWRDRFVSNGGIDTLVELLLTRDWDPARRGVDVRGEEGESTAGISLACLALLLGLIERFLEEKYLPEPRQLGRLVRGQGLARVALRCRLRRLLSKMPRFVLFCDP